MANDVLREQVYSAEKQVWAALARVPQSSTVDFFGSQLTVAPERRFTDLVQIQHYADDVIAQWNRDYKVSIGNVTVRQRKGEERAHYEYDGAVIAIPIATGWALRELVCLHEIAHHLTFQYFRSAVAHGPEFAGMYVQLVSTVMGAEVGLLLRAAFDGIGVDVKVFA